MENKGTNGGAPPGIVLEYRRAPQARRGARFIRVGLLIVAIAAIHLAAILILHPTFPRFELQGFLGGGVIGTPFSPLTITKTVDAKQIVYEGDERHLDQYLPRALFYLFLFLVTQWWFLTPKGKWKISLGTGAPISRRSAIAAGFIGMLLSIGLIAALLEIPNWWIALTTENGLQTPQRFGVVWAVMAVMWLGWSFVFWTYYGSMERYSAMQKIFRWLLAGTVLELVIAGPAHALIVAERGGECYCQRGTWTGVAFGATAALWLFGPGAFLLFLREKKRREELI